MIWKNLVDSKFALNCKLRLLNALTMSEWAPFKRKVPVKILYEYTWSARALNLTWQPKHTIMFNLNFEWFIKLVIQMFAISLCNG